MTKQEFIDLFQKFIDSLDDTHRDEYYNTEAGISQRTLDRFIEWLDKEEDNDI